ncbi:hypothetical protein BJ741DRAFT_186010 [Chytriomyces cf. hyalinus JEL632]|nr:hypothetical protein BJ741DRAFT_186010 [Chytriomyces cf. hyalinus JEL632]
MARSPQSFRMITTAAVFDLSKHSITATPSPRFNSINCYQPCANWIPNIILWLYDDCTPCFRYGSKSRWRCSYIIGRNTTSSAATSAPSTYSSAAPLFIRSIRNRLLSSSCFHPCLKEQKDMPEGSTSLSQVCLHLYMFMLTVAEFFFQRHTNASDDTAAV